MQQRADRDANSALWARFDEVRAQYQHLRSGMDDLQQRLAGLAVTAESPDGLVSATVGPRGSLVGLRLDPGIYQAGDQDELARTILATVEQATARTADEVRDLLAEYLPPDSAVAGYLQQPEEPDGA